MKFPELQVLATCFRQRSRTGRLNARTSYSRVKPLPHNQFYAILEALESVSALFCCTAAVRCTSQDAPATQEPGKHSTLHLPAPK